MTLNTPTLDIDDSSDTGTLGDGITTDSSPLLKGVFPDRIVAGDTLLIQDNGLTLVSHIVTDGELAGSAIPLGLNLLTNATHLITVKQIRGADFSDFSSPLTITVITPTLTSPALVFVSSTQTNCKVTTDGIDGVLYTVLTLDAVAPNIAQIIAGKNSSGINAEFSGHVAITSTGTKNIPTSALQIGTTYYAHFVHKTDNQSTSAVVSSSAFAAGSFSAESNQFFNRITAPSDADKLRLSNLIDGIVSDGDWNAIGDLHILAQDIEANALVNLKSSNFTATKVGSPTFAAYQGFTGTGLVSDYLNTGFMPLGSGIMTQNSGAILAYILNNRTIAQVNVVMGGGNTGNTDSTYISPHYSGSITFAEVNSFTFASVASTTSKGCFLTTRTDSTTSTLVINGGQSVTAFSAPSVGLPDQNIIVLATNGSSGVVNASSDQCAAYMIAQGLTLASAQRVSNRVNTYMAALTVPKNVY